MSSPFKPSGRPTLAPVSPFALALMGARVFREVTIANTGGLRCKMRVLTRRENQEVDSATRRFMEELGTPLTTGSSLEYQAELVTRSLAIACRDYTNPDYPLASLDEWKDFADDGVIGSLWVAYESLRDELDPMDAVLTPEEIDELKGALKKKDATLLRSYGLPKLVSFMLTMESQQST